ncbi:hypothetical protein LCGC14_1236550 [marine sediment metagenome]|uniref:Uncharacterized protein n=1 Tax=marine sediment metagenome TaxID=412755 RepID=A0A0F9LB52_9ZZZZ
MNCVVCDKPIGKKARTCGPTCRSKLARSVASSVSKPSVASSKSPSVATPVTDLELCRYCSEPLPALAKPRRWPGACYPFAMKAPRKSSIEALGEVVCAGPAYIPPTMKP